MAARTTILGTTSSSGSTSFLNIPKNVQLTTAHGAARTAGWTWINYSNDANRHLLPGENIYGTNMKETGHPKFDSYKPDGVSDTLLLRKQRIYSFWMK